MIGVFGFIDRVKKIAERDLKYRTGGTGKDGTCDCIGLIMGAMYELGAKKYDLHSTNYFARYQTMEMVTLRSGTEIYAGMILYKARDDQDKLNGRYLPGGRYYTGDVLDYYHVGVVTSAKPLEIIECTEYGDVTGIVKSDNIKGWNYGGKLRGVLYEGYDGEEDEEEGETMSVLYMARVITQEDPLTLRATANGRKIGEIPKGEEVEVLAEGEWAWVRYGEMLGYVSSKYLERIEKDYAELTVRTILTDSEGNTWEPAGAFSVRVQLEADGEAID